MRKRHLKKWVKVFLSIIILILTICTMFIFLNRDNVFNTKNTKKSIPENDNKIINNNINTKNNQEDLERFLYKDGFYFEKLSHIIKEKITGNSFPKKFSSKYTAISYDDLRYLKLKYKDFSGIEHNDGEMIVNKNVAKEVLAIFYELYINDYSINKIKLVEEYNASDELSMQDNNTSSFNYRMVEMDDKLSWHCFGLAIDINPLYNPYILGDELYPSTAKKYIDRTKEFAGKIDHQDLAYITFIKYGWKWGGDFINSKDYQHFYKEIYDSSIRDSKE